MPSRETWLVLFSRTASASLCGVNCGELVTDRDYRRSERGSPAFSAKFLQGRLKIRVLRLRRLENLGALVPWNRISGAGAEREEWALDLILYWT